MKLEQITNIEAEDVDYRDYPDFCDAFIVSADLNGVPMTEEQIEELNEDTYLKYDCVLKNQGLL